MKTTSIVLTFGLLAVTPVIADIAVLKNSPPPKEMIDAYPVAVKVLGTNAAQYHCVCAMPIQTYAYNTRNFSNHLSGEWSFAFINTNRSEISVWVFFDDMTGVIVQPTGF